MSLLVLAGVGAGGFFVYRSLPLPGFSWLRPGHHAAGTPAAKRPKSVAAAEQAHAPYVPAIIDLPGDPLIIRIGRGGNGADRLRSIAVPPDLTKDGIDGNIEVLADTMLSSSERFMTTLPSSPQDFAFFQAQSARGERGQPAAQPVSAPAGTPAPIADDDAKPASDDPYGDATDFNFTPVASQNDGASAPGDAGQPAASAPPPASGAGAPPPPAAKMPGAAQGAAGAPTAPPSEASGIAPPASAAGAGNALPGGGSAGAGAATNAGSDAAGFKKTPIADTMSLRKVTPEADRFAHTDDIMVRVLNEETFESVLAAHGFDAADARNAGDAAKALFDVTTLPVGSVVAMRGRRAAAGAKLTLVQATIDTTAKYVGTIALSDSGGFVSGADPWIGENLLDYTKSQPAQNQPKQRYRLLDAIYSTAIRNQVPTGVIGEAIMLLSRTFDLNAFVEPNDKLILVYAKAPRDPKHNAGRVLYAAIAGNDKDFQCYVYQFRPGGDFACMTEKSQARTVAVVSGMVTPVDGVLSEPFGPNRRPGSNKVHVNKGVDWTAPLGTPVLAAFDGTVAFTGDEKDLGKVVRLDHGHRKETLYGHLQRFASGVEKGARLKAGDVVGYVGDSGRVNSPDLHFELIQNGVPVNPLSSGAAIAQDQNGSAVDLLVDRIIGVESGHNANAKNPLSSATGLGQFIDSTWIRMMNTYRPDLARSMSRAALLALRSDPTLSREMVADLARENEAYLRADGHAITAGVLYLAHFLGPDGANTVLDASPDALLSSVLGDAVIRANPFLTGKTASYVIGWAEAKMHGHGGGISTADAERRVIRASPQFIQYREAMQKIVQQGGTAL